MHTDRTWPVCLILGLAARQTLAGENLKILMGRWSSGMNDWMHYFDRQDIGWSTGGGRGYIHRFPSRASCIAKQPILCTFPPPERGIQALAWRD
jgi:hypothetical protein